MTASPLVRYVLLRFELEKPVKELEALSSQRCWSIDGVGKCDPVDVETWHKGPPPVPAKND